jgi:phosphatidylglycerophosphatase A
VTGSLARAIATFGYVGRLPKAPGTWASAVTLLLWWLAGPQSIAVQAAAIAVVLLVGTPAASGAESSYGHDDGRIVIDEVAGMLLAVFALPMNLAVAIGGFVLFRLFDIAKPPPAYQLQALPRGLGVMADDVASGVLANLVLRLGLFLVPSLAELPR